MRRDAGARTDDDHGDRRGLYVFAALCIAQFGLFAQMDIEHSDADLSYGRFRLRPRARRRLEEHAHVRRVHGGLHFLGLGGSRKVGATQGSELTLKSWCRCVGERRPSAAVSSGVCVAALSVGRAVWCGVRAAAVSLRTDGRTGVQTKSKASRQESKCDLNEAEDFVACVFIFCFQLSLHTAIDWFSAMGMSTKDVLFSEAFLERGAIVIIRDLSE